MDFRHADNPTPFHKYKYKTMEKLTDLSPMPFGTHKNEKMANVPARYLLFIYEQDWIDKWPRVKGYIEENYRILQMQAKKERQDQDEYNDMQGSEFDIF